MILKYLYDSILFDFDGVLLDSEPVHFQCWKQILEPLGVRLDWETYIEKCIGVSDYEMLVFLGSRADPPVPAERLWQEYPRKNALFVERISRRPPVPAETRKLLEELHLQLPLAVVSSSSQREVVTILETAGLRPFFRTVVCSEDVSRHKPDPEPYRIAAARLGVERPLVVEDSESGEKSGRAAGFDVVRVASAEETAARVRERISNFR